MDNHQNILEKLCRLCGTTIKVNDKCTLIKEVHQCTHEIKALFEYDVRYDNLHIHPKGICSSCRRKMDRCKKALGNGEEISTQQKIIPFQEHSDICLVCEKKFPVRPFKVKVTHSREQSKSNNEKLEDKDVVVAAATNGMQQLSNEHLTFGKIDIENGIPIITKSVVIEKDLTWKVYIFKKQVPVFCDVLKPYRCVLRKDIICQFFKTLLKANVCCGNADFPSLITSKLEKGSELDFLDKDGNVKATIQSKYYQSVKELDVIRTTSCHVLVVEDKDRCNNCSKYRKQLNVYKDRLVKREKAESISKNTPISTFSRAEIEKQYLNLRKEKRTIAKSEKRLYGRIERMVERESIALDKESDMLLEEVISKSDKCFDEDSPQYLLWEQQRKQLGLKRKSSMKWHPVVIRWCLAIYLKSPGTYNLIRSSGFLQLPHQSTLSKYTGFASTGSSFNPDIIKRLIDESNITEAKEYEKNVMLLFDEMKVKAGLIFSRSTGKLIGFVELGDINEELQQFSLLSKKKERPIATHIMSFMVRGIFKHINFPIAYFPSNGFDSYQLYPCVWEALRILESVGFKVRGLVSDGATPNRKFYRMHLHFEKDNQKDGVTYWTWNRYAPNRKLYFFSDPPHLVKTLRNNWENSHGHLNTRNLVYNGKHISWQHFISVYEWDLGIDRFAPGLRRMPKITEEHVNLNPALRMRVHLAAQALSETVANAMDVQDIPETESTRLFIRHIDKFFDCLNVSRTYSGQSKRKDALMPYFTKDDWRFDWLVNEFLQFFTRSKNDVDAIEGMTSDEKARCYISYQTFEGLKLTVYSFVELCKTLLEIDGVMYILSDKFNQDPLQEHFGRQRMKGGGIDNPTVENYGHNERKIILAKSEMLTVMQGNTRKRYRDEAKIDVHDERELPKRKKK